MLDYLAPVLFAVLVWWVSTGIVLYLVRLPPRLFGWLGAAGAGMLAAALYGLDANGGETTAAGAYLAFTYALLVWGVIEYAFLTGLVTGPSSRPCPDGARGFRRAGFAIEAILYHELALIAAGIAVAAATWGAPNQIGLWTFVLLWTMRASAKLNLFLGVRILNAEFLPDRLKFLASYFRQRPMNGLFPVSITVATTAVVLLAQRAAAADATAFETAGFALLAALMALAVLEHWFMLLPLPVVALWKWGLRGSGPHPLPPAPAIDAVPLTDSAQRIARRSPPLHAREPRQP